MGLSDLQAHPKNPAAHRELDIYKRGSGPVVFPESMAARTLPGERRTTHKIKTDLTYILIGFNRIIPFFKINSNLNQIY